MSKYTIKDVLILSNLREEGKLIAYKPENIVLAEHGIWYENPRASASESEPSNEQQRNGIQMLIRNELVRALREYHVPEDDIQALTDSMEPGIEKWAGEVARGEYSEEETMQWVRDRALVIASGYMAPAETLTARELREIDEAARMEVKRIEERTPKEIADIIMVDMRPQLISKGLVSLWKSGELSMIMPDWMLAELGMIIEQKLKHIAARYQASNWPGRLAKEIARMQTMVIADAGAPMAVNRDWHRHEPVFETHLQKLVDEIGMGTIKAAMVVEIAKVFNVPEASVPAEYRKAHHALTTHL